jgi:hypothetical protein
MRGKGARGKIKIAEYSKSIIEISKLQGKADRKRSNARKKGGREIRGKNSNIDK